MKPRRVVISFDIETDLPVKVLREGWVCFACDDGAGSAILVNKPRVEVIQPVKRKAGRK